MLLPKIQRTKVESKSQLLKSVVSKDTWLLPKIQRTKVESKSQLKVMVPILAPRCYQKYKEQKLKANHNCYNFPMAAPAVVTKNTKNKS